MDHEHVNHKLLNLLDKSSVKQCAMAPNVFLNVLKATFNCIGYPFSSTLTYGLLDSAILVASMIRVVAVKMRVTKTYRNFKKIP